LRKALKGRAEFFFVDAPHVAIDASTEATDKFSGASTDGRTWWQWRDKEPLLRPSKSYEYSLWDDSVAAISAALRELWPIDGLLGFSQGATAAALWLAQAHGSGNSEIVSHTPRWAVIIGGFLPRDEKCAGVLRRAAPLPKMSLHVCGSQDSLIEREQSEALWKCFSEDLRSVYEHSGGHMVPTCSGEFKQALVQFLDAVGLLRPNTDDSVHST